MIGLFGVSIFGNGARGCYYGHSVKPQGGLLLGSSGLKLHTFRVHNASYFRVVLQNWVPFQHSYTGTLDPFSGPFYQGC